MASLVVSVVLLVAAWWTWRREPRRLRVGVLLVAAAWFALGAVLQLLGNVFPREGVWALLPLLPVPLTVLVLAGLLVANGLTMVRKEGRRLGNLLSLLVGLALVAVPVVAVALIRSSVRWLEALAALAFFVSVYLGAAFAVVLAYSMAYATYTARAGSPSRPGAPVPAAVVVLGSGLVRGKVPRLLAGRLDRAVEEWSRLRSRGERTLVIPSGGQGADEPRSEGAAMAEYLLAHGVPDDELAVEGAARTTQENLQLSLAVARSQGREGPITVVTSGYHVPRAALLSHRLGLDAVVVGSRTARYFVPSAYLREFVAIMSYHPRLHALLVLPAVGFTVLLARTA